MPERQSSPGEVTERPETGDTTNGSAGAVPEPAESTGGGAELVAEQIADQVAAEPQAVEPAAQLGEPAPVADDQVLDADAAVDLADPVAHSAPGSGESDPAPGGQHAAPVDVSPEPISPDLTSSEPISPEPTSSDPIPAEPTSAGSLFESPTPHSPSAGDSWASDARYDSSALDPSGPDPSVPHPVTASLDAPDPGAADLDSADPAASGPVDSDPTAPDRTVPDFAAPAPASPAPGSPAPDTSAPDSPSAPDAGRSDEPGTTAFATTPAAVGPRPTSSATHATGPGSAAGSAEAAAEAAAAEADTVRTPAQPETRRPRPAPESPTVALPVAASATPPSTGSDGPSSWDSEATQVIPLQGAAHGEPPTTATPLADPPTERIAVGASGAVPPPTPPGGTPATSGSGSRKRMPLLIVAAVVALLAIVYVADLLLSSGSVPRGVTVAGVAVGGLSLADAEQELRTQIEPRRTMPVQVSVGEVTTEIDPAAAGLAVDWQGTLNQAGAQPLNPITRLTSLFTQREIGVVTTADDAAVAAALEEIAPIVDREPAEGTVRFEGATPLPVDPIAGQRLDQPAAIAVLERDWASGTPVSLPLIALPTISSPEDVATAIETIAAPAVSAPVAVVGEGGTQGTLEPEVIASALSFTADPADGTLVPALNPTVVTDALTPQLAGSERPARDATLDFSSGTPTVVPSEDGRGVDYEATLRDLLPVLTGTGPRQITAVYADQPADLTTEEASALGNAGVISEFQTGGFASDSGQNIRRAAEAINGTIVEPGETFSLNAATAPRTAANGYVEAGIISEGHPSRGIGGGVSQVATTLYNAGYLAGMTDIEHREHSFYIQRYPAGREATVFDDVIDMRFRNDNPTPILIQTAWTPTSLTIRILGNRRFEVTGSSGPRTNPTSPNTITIPAGEPCSPSQGAPGFTITDTRTLRDVNTGEVTTENRTVRYNPSPIVVCGG